MAEMVDVVFGPVGDIGFMAARVEEFFRQTSVDPQSEAQRRDVEATKAESIGPRPRILRNSAAIDSGGAAE